MNDLLPVLALVRWLHLSALVVLFGATAFPLYAPTGRFLDRSLRLSVRIAAVVALATAFAETGFASRGLPRLSLLVFACLITFSLRRNSWTVRTQAAVLAVVAGLALVSLSYVRPAAAAPAGWRTILEAAALLAAGAWLGGLVPLRAVTARVAAAAEPVATAAAALQRVSMVAALAAPIVLIAGIVFAATRGGPPLSVRVLEAVSFAILVGLALLARCALGPRLATDRAAAGSLATSIRLQLVVAFAFLGTVALAWSLSAPP